MSHDLRIVPVGNSRPIEIYETSLLAVLYYVAKQH